MKEAIDYHPDITLWQNAKMFLKMLYPNDLSDLRLGGTGGAKDYAHTIDFKMGKDEYRMVFERDCKMRLITCETGMDFEIKSMRHLQWFLDGNLKEAAGLQE